MVNDSLIIGGDLGASGYPLSVDGKMIAEELRIEMSQKSFPLGWFNSVNSSHDHNIELSFSLRSAGNVVISLTEYGHDVPVYPGYQEQGYHTVKIDVSTMPPGFNHAIMYHDGRVADYQELQLD